jgi:hypothetical protein
VILRTTTLAGAILLTANIALAQTSPGGPAATSKTGDPAASSASNTPATTGSNQSGKNILPRQGGGKQ